MKRREIENCIVCDEGVAHDNQIVFYQVKIDHLVLSLNAIRRQHGLEMMLGSPELAHVMGPDESLTQELSSNTYLICQSCAIAATFALILTSISTKEQREELKRGLHGNKKETQVET